MKTKPDSFILVLLLLIPFYTHAESSGDPYMGDYEGTFAGNQKCVAEVFPVGNKEYIINFMPAFAIRAEKYACTKGSEVNGKIIFYDTEARGEISNDSLKGEFLYVPDGYQAEGRWVPFGLAKSERSSPTEGVKPPPESIILFDGSGYDKWTGISDAPVKWKIVNGNEMEVLPSSVQPITYPKNDIHTKLQFTDFFLHLEFKLPLMAEIRNQWRANSGVMFQGIVNICELQILDSYGLEGHWRECGSLYKMSPPKVNICLPPLRWQTYDIIFHSPRYDKDGRLIKYGDITVFHNAKRIHHQYPIKRGPEQLENGQTDFPVSIGLQDHRNVLWFRNIWAIDLKENPDLPEFMNNLSE